MTNGRRKARGIALQVLYEYDCSTHNPEGIIDRIVEEQSLNQETTLFIRELVLGVGENQTKIDATIQEFASAWPLAQIPAIDKNILRLAIFESLINNKVPPKVAINEAVELAKKFGSDGSARFVNGVLGSVHGQYKEKCTTGNNTD
jgi:transcription antitermination protein NusB